MTTLRTSKQFIGGAISRRVREDYITARPFDHSWHMSRLSWCGKDSRQMATCKHAGRAARSLGRCAVGLSAMTGSLIAEKSAQEDK